jgi:hypothetical protein
MDLLIYLLIDCKAWILVTLIIQQTQISRIVVAYRLNEIEVTPASFYSERPLTFYRTPAKYLEGNTLPDVGSIPVCPTKEVRTHRAGAFTLWAEHPEIGHKRVVGPKEVNQADIAAVFVLETVVLLDRRA